MAGKQVDNQQLKYTCHMKIDNNQQKFQDFAIALMLIIGMSSIIPITLILVHNFENQNNRYKQSRTYISS